MDIVSEAISRVISHLDKPNFVKLVQGLAQEVQTIEDIKLELFNRDNLNWASGVWVDEIGLPLGVHRNGDDDITYKKRIRDELSLKNINATVEGLIQAALYYTKAEKVCVLERPAPCTGTFVVIYEGDSVNGGFIKYIEKVKPAGVKMFVIDDHAYNFKPAWMNIQHDPIETLESLILSNSETDTLILSPDTSDVLLVNTTYAGLPYYNLDYERAILPWLSKSSLLVTKNGIDSRLTVTGGKLSVVTGNSLGESKKGAFSQIITEETT